MQLPNKYKIPNTKENIKAIQISGNRKCQQQQKR